MIPAIQELNFPKIDGKQYATLSHATVNLADMGEKTISTQVKIDGDIVPDFSQDWEVAFQGEKYIMPLRLPQGAKENTSLNSTIDLTFQHWAIWQLKRWTFVTMQPIDTGTAVADEEVASVQLNLKDFCDLFGQVLEYYYGDTITIDFNDDPETGWQYDNAPTAIEISHSYIWDVLIKLYELFAVRWAIEPREDNDNTVKGGERYVIKIGYPTTEVDHIFEYGFEGGLLKLERQVQSEEIHNMIKGRGGNTNIPFRYFKDTDPNNEDFASDPDWVEELKNIYFTNLMPATYRSYIQGWKAAHISKYPGYKAVGENNAYSPWAYRKGFTDEKFHPVEFVADEITLNPQEGDRQVQIFPDYSPFVKKGSSIDVYGPLLAPLDNNDDIYPTIQGTGLDIAVDVEQILSDDVAESVESDAVLSELDPIKGTAVNVSPGKYQSIIIDGGEPFIVNLGKRANLDVSLIVARVTSQGKDVAPLVSAQLHGTPTINVYDAFTGEKRSASGIPPGKWRYEVIAEVHNLTKEQTLNITVEGAIPRLTSATPEDKWQNTFDIWVKNIWNTQKGVDKDGNVIKETDAQYAERVWKPILGDRDKNTAKVVFTSGMLLHEDYEFTIVDFPVPDTSKTYTDSNDVRHDSHWRITLAKSDAELEATGLYVPSTQKQGKAGDTFAFIGTEMTHVPYVVDAEIRLDDWKKDHLGEVKEIKPTFVVTTDRVRLNNEGKPDALINQLRVGNSLRIADKRFIQPMGDRAYETLYLQSLTYTFREPTPEDAALNPDVEIVLSNEYTTSANPVSVMQSEVNSMQKLLGAISNVEQIVRAVGDKLYLRKDGISDRSLSPTQFFSLLTSGDFRAGIVGGAGWGFFKDENGNWVFEADRVNVRQEMQVNTLVINQAEGRGGMEIDTAALMEVTHVVEVNDGYICYFDQKNGSVANLFHVDDVAYCNRWTPENQELKFYKRRVMAVGVDNITLTKGYDPIELPDGTIDTGVNGTGIPAEKDNIIHFGNYTDETRQYVKVRDVVGGGYERFLDGLDSVNAKGTEYYFVGRQAGLYNNRPRWYVGDENGYIEWVDGKLTIKGSLSVQSTIGDQTIKDYISTEVGKAAGALLIDLDDEIVPLACDAQGNVLAGLPFTTQVHVYRGSAEDSGWIFNCAATGCTASIDRDTGVITVSAVMEDVAKVVVYAGKKGQVTLTTTLDIYKVRPGANGEAATVYRLLPSVNTISKDAQGQLSTSDVSCEKQKITGDSPATATTELYLYANIIMPNGSSGWLLIAEPGKAQGSVPISSSVSAVVFELRTSGTSSNAVVLDRERIPVLTDASGLEIGGVNMLLNSDFLDGIEHWYRIDNGLTVSAKPELEGRRSIRLDSTGQTASFFYHIYQAVDAKELTDYTLSFYAKSPDTETAAIRLSVTFLDAAGSTISSDFGAINNLLDGADWSYITKTFKTPEKTSGIAVMIAMSRSGEVSINGPKLEQGNRATPWSLSPLDGGYLRRALKGSTEIDGGLVLTTMVQTGERAEDGSFLPKSGLNGSYDRNEEGGGIAVWAGGRPVDRATSPNDSNAATMLFRMNGTGYAAGNTLKFLLNELRVGLNDVIRLTQQGLFMYDAQGNPRMRIADEPVTFNLNELGAQKSNFGSSTARNYSVVYTSDIAYIGLNNPATTLPIYTLGILSTGALVSAKGNATVPVSLPTSPGLLRLPALQVDIEKLVDGAWVSVASYKAQFFQSFSDSSTLKADLELTHVITSDGSYRIRPYLSSASNERPSTGLRVSTMSYIFYGERSKSVTGCSAIGNNGLMSVWPDAALGINESGFVARVGTLGIKIDPAMGIMATMDGTNWGYLGFTLNNGSSWSPLKA